MWYCRTRSVGVGFPNPLGKETSPLRGYRVLNFGVLPPFAPEERYVYSSATRPIPALQRSAMWYCRTRSVGVGFPNPLGKETSPPTIDTAPQIVPHLPPAGRHVNRNTGGTKIGT